MLDALNEVRTEKSVKSVTKKYKIPRTTLMYKLSGKMPIRKKKGPKSIFPLSKKKFW